MAEDFFIIEHEGHIGQRHQEEGLKHYIDYQRFEHSFEGAIRQLMADEPLSKEVMKRRAQAQMPKTPEIELEEAIERMDRAGIDIACLVPHRHAVHMNVDPRGPSMSWMIEACKKYPDRLIPAPVFEPSTRGVENAIWELEYMVKEHGCKYGKIYPPGELWDMNDRRYWPFYAKAQELGVVIGFHTGHGYVYGANTHAAMPRHLEDVCREFYDLNIIAFHFGWPWHHELNCLAASYPGLNIGMSYLNQMAMSRPRFFAKILGEALMYAGVDKVIWSHDGIATPQSVDSFRKFQFSEDLQRDYGFKPIAEEDRAKIFGLNMARLIGIEPVKRAGKPAAK